LSNQGRSSRKWLSAQVFGRRIVKWTIIASLQLFPLKKEITFINFDLDSLDPLDQDIKNQSMENLATLVGKKGVSFRGAVQFDTKVLWTDAS
jgi:hypothetical protein